jgi:hypothetical protein
MIGELTFQDEWMNKFAFIMIFMGKRREMVTVVTELLDTVYCVRLKDPQCFEGRICLLLQVEWEESRCCCVEPSIPSLNGE